VISALIFGYLPFARPAQLYLLRLEDEQRHFAAFAITASAVAGFFKSMITAFGTFPKGADRDLSTWLLYFTSNPEPRFGRDGRLITAAPGELRNRLACLCSKFIWGGFFFSVLQPPRQDLSFRTYFETHSMFDTPPAALFGNGPAATWLLTPLDPFQMFGALNSTTELFTGVLEFFMRSLHTYLWGWAMYLFLSTSLDITALPTLLRGVSCEPGFASPLWVSRSAKEVWGARWNRPVNLFLKRGVFKPVAFRVGVCRNGFGRLAGTAATFLASGLLHEYVFSLLFGGCYGIHSVDNSSGHFSSSDEVRCSEMPSFLNPGFVTVFFVLQGSGMAAEQLLAAWLRRRGDPDDKTELFDDFLPAPLVSVVHSTLNAVAFNNLFLFPWVASGFFHAAASLFPALVLNSRHPPR
jgi:hypothetical protein